jgi:hypothetical protein
MKREYTPPHITELDPADVPADAVRQFEQQREEREQTPDDARKSLTANQEAD